MSKRFRVASITAALVLSLTGVGSSWAVAPRNHGLPENDEPFQIDPARFTTQIGNRYWPMEPGMRWTYEETDAEGGLLSVVVTVTSETKEIANGVTARVVRDTVTDEERRKQADPFDQLLGKLNIKVAASGGFYGNLIGNSIRDIFSSEEIVYQTRPDSQVTQSVTGVYSGSDYTITDADGNVFFTDRYGSNVQQFPFDDDVDATTIKDTDTIDYDADTGAITLTREGGTFCLPLADVIDIAAERERLAKTLDKLEKEARAIRGKLANAAFVSRAPEEVVDEQRTRLEAADAEIEVLKAAADRLASLGG